MTLSVYESVIERKDYQPDELFSHLETIAPGIFEDLWSDSEFASLDAKKRVLLYIILCYSKESDNPVLGAASDAVKNNIATYTGIPDYHRKAVLMLDNKSVRSTILRYLDFQSDRDFRHLENLKMRYDALMSASIEDMKGEDGKTDYKMLVQSAQLSNQLWEEIQTVEDKIRAKHAYVGPNKDEIKKVSQQAQSDTIQSLNIESSPSVRDRKQ